MANMARNVVVDANDRMRGSETAAEEDHAWMMRMSPLCAHHVRRNMRHMGHQLLLDETTWRPAGDYDAEAMRTIADWDASSEMEDHSGEANSSASAFSAA